VPEDWLYGLSGWAIAALMAVLFGGGAFLGVLLGRRARAAAGESETRVGTLQGAVFGLLGLLLSFTFAMSVGRYDTRRQVVLEEANAIGTASLRADLVPEPERSEMHRLYHELVDARLAFYEAGRDKGRLAAANQIASRLFDALWAACMRAVEKRPHEVTNGILVQSLNDVIDASEKRVTAQGAHVPDVVLWLLLGVSTLAMALTGYAHGDGRQLALVAAVAVAVALVIVVIVDLDRPSRGFIRVSQGSMERLRDGMNR
jgi:hypothetical protein